MAGPNPTKKGLLTKMENQSINQSINQPINQSTKLTNQRHRPHLLKPAIVLFRAAPQRLILKDGLGFPYVDILGQERSVKGAIPALCGPAVAQQAAFPQQLAVGRKDLDVVFLQVPANASAFGVCHNGDTEGNLDYFCGLSVPDFEGIGATNDRLTVPAQRYAKFRHEGHISEMQDFWAAIFNDGLPQSGVEKTEGADLEYYGPEFDPMSGEGGYEVWIAVK